MAAGAVREPSARGVLKNLVSDRAEIDLYLDSVFKTIRVGDLAENALKRY